MKTFNIETSELKISRGKEERITFTITGENESMITYNQVKKLVNKLQEKNGFDKNKIIVRGMVDQLRQLKGFNSDFITDEDLEEYYNNKSKEKIDTSKFKKFSQISITVYK